MATIYEVSELAGVSLATVSRVMNDSGKVTAKTRHKVESAMKELGYRPNSMARSLASNRTDSVGVLVPMFSGPFYGEILSGIETELRAAGKHVIITAGHSDKAIEKTGIEFLLSRNCDALILHVDAVSDDYLAKLSRGPVPIVVIGRHIKGNRDNCINLDNELGGYLATKSALVLGHKEFAYISGPLWKHDAHDRMEGHKRALAEHGIEFNVRLLYEGNFQESSGSRGMEELLRIGQPFSVVICANDEMAAGALGVARERGLEIPDDISVIGFDNVFFTRYFRPKLSTIDYQISGMGQMAARRVLQSVYGWKDLRVQNMFEPTVVMRSSVKCKTGR
ncbi:LacI family DNA-binding transcriptional regulator [Pseudomonadota bacterium]